MKFCFLDWVVDGRGMSQSLYNYALRLNVDVEILVGKIDNSARESFEPSAISRLKKKFVVTRFDGLSELTSTVRLRSCNAVYVQHLSAKPQPFVKAIQDGGAKVSFHCMGWCSHRQGDSFATISEWASKRFHQPHYVPLMVNPCLSDSVANRTVFRSSIGVSETDTLVCYLGSKHSFDHNIVRQLFSNVSWMSEYPRIHFAFMPRPEWFSQIHWRMHFVPFSTNELSKYEYIKACDGMLHGRSNGESFGMAVAEFASCNKPVITASAQSSGGGYETAHLEHLKSKALQ
jgi:hypothetical protein